MEDNFKPVLRNIKEELLLFRCEICHTLKAETYSPELKSEMGLPCHMCKKVTTHTHVWMR